MVKAWPEYNKWQLLSEAVKKHTNHDISFTLLSNEWTRSLIYPDGMRFLEKTMYCVFQFLEKTMYIVYFRRV
jgi:hypothetical protein